jgi:ATP-dependent helicase/nuclease subunit A
MLAQLWPTLAAATPAAALPPEPPLEPVAIVPKLRRLAMPPAIALLDVPAVAPGAEARPEFSWAGETAIHVGTLVHRYLQRFAEEGLSDWAPERVRAMRGAFAAELALLGVERGEQRDAAERVAMALARTLEDSGGRWLLGAHAEARAELTLTLRTGAALEHIRIDRTFVDDGTRWIVDYKTSQHEGGEEEAFLASEVQRYAPQLERYAHALHALDGRPVQLCLYFPLLGRLRSWPALVRESQSA